ncbi:hypothetical protein ABPG75_003203 [Micractinium tetrahymenae]
MPARLEPLLCLMGALWAATDRTQATPPVLGRHTASRRALQQAPAPEAACLQSQALQWAIQEYAPLTMCRGGALQFTWTGIHTLVLVPGPFCPNDWSGPGIVQLSPLGAVPPSGGSYTASMNDTGTLYFACSYSTHCLQGQHVVVNVV